MENKNRKSNRLQYYDYSQNGMYFVTICTKDREELFGKVENGEMMLNELGRMAEKYYLEIPKYFDSIYLDRYIIMPNHIHGIIEINQDILKIQKNNVGVQFIEPEGTEGFDKSVGLDKSSPYEMQIKNNPMLSNKITLGKIIRYYKARTACEIKKQIKFWKFSWQRNYYDHIIRNEISLNKIKEYIINNPKVWERDRNNVENIWM